MKKELMVFVVIGMIGSVLFMFTSMNIVSNLLDMIIWYGGGLGILFGCTFYGFYKHYKKEKEAI